MTTNPASQLLETGITLAILPGITAAIDSPATFQFLHTLVEGALKNLRHTLSPPLHRFDVTLRCSGLLESVEANDRMPFVAAQPLAGNQVFAGLQARLLDLLRKPSLRLVGDAVGVDGRVQVALNSNASDRPQTPQRHSRVRNQQIVGVQGRAVRAPPPHEGPRNEVVPPCDLDAVQGLRMGWVGRCCVAQLNHLDGCHL